MLDLRGEVLSGGCKSGFGGRGQLKFFLPVADQIYLIR